MVWDKFKVLVVIPARGGSKAIPRKNMCEIGGISLVGHAARVARALSWVDRIVLSTDNEEIAVEGKKYGIEVPFLRPVELAGDRAKSVDMWRHAWLASEEFYGHDFDVSILLEPTSPLRVPGDVEETLLALVKGDYKAAATVSLAPAHFTPHKCLMIDKNGFVKFYMKDGARYSLRQEVPSFYFRNGICYAVKRKTLVEDGLILEEECAAIVIERPVINIDEPLDLEIAEFLWNRQNLSEQHQN